MSNMKYGIIAAMQEEMQEIKKIMDTQPGFIYAPWCGDETC